MTDLRILLAQNIKKFREIRGFSLNGVSPPFFIIFPDFFFNDMIYFRLWGNLLNSFFL